MVPEVTGIGASRVLLVGLGKQDAFNQKAYGEAVRAAILALRELTYKFTQMKSKPDNGARSLKKIVFSIDSADEKAAKTALKQGVAIANGMGVALVPQSLRHLRRTGVVYRPLLDPGPIVETGLVWRFAEVSPVLAGFIEIVRSRAESAGSV